MLNRYNPQIVEHALRATAASPSFPPAADRAGWQAIGDALGPSRRAAMVAEAEIAVRTPIPVLTATGYLEFQRTGQREGYQAPKARRGELLASLVLAECLEGRGRFLDAVLDLAWARCEESSWAYPAHQGVLADLNRPYIDLGAAGTALELAELDVLLGAQLDPALGKRIRDEVDRRCLTPYLERHDHWWLYDTPDRPVNNWTAVCNAGVAGAAIYLESDPARLAAILARAARSLDDYLATFDPDGGSSEGPGYWSYGFGHYAVLAHLVEHRTAGAISLLDEDLIPKIAQFPLRTLLSPGHPVTFSDCRRDASFNPSLLAYLAERLDLPPLMRLAREQPGAQPDRPRAPSGLTWALRDLAWRPSPGPPGGYRLAGHDWYPGLQWLFARSAPSDPAALTLAAKGGHNDEMHNQNDVGNVVVHFQGESLVADLGYGRATKAYFGPERYDHFVTSSLGHSVPLPNGQAQRPGRRFAAHLLEHRATDADDLLALELKDAYPTEAGLASLRRTVALHREAPSGWVSLDDAVRFATGPGTLESVLTTFGEVEIGAEAALIRGERGQLRVRYDPAVVVARREVVPEVDLANGRATVTRLVFALRTPAEEATIRLRLEPVG